MVPCGDGADDVCAEGGGGGAEIEAFDFGEDGEGDCAAEGVAAVGGAMGAGAEDVAEGEMVGGGDWAVADPDGTEREAAGDALGPADGVRGEVWGDGFPAAPMAGAAEA